LRAVALFGSAGLNEARDYAKDHLSIIRRFGRFPHRNAILGRSGTAEEVEFLAQHDDHYGQRAGEAPDRIARPGQDLPASGVGQGRRI
jgi:hypothetical protein